MQAVNNQHYVTQGTAANGSIGVYNQDGTPVNASLLTAASGGIFWGPVSDGSNLFVTDNNNGTVGEFGLDGTPINASLISGLNGSTGIALYGGNLYVENNWTGVVGNISRMVPPLMIRSLRVWVMPQAFRLPPRQPRTPEPSTVLLALPAACVLFGLRRRQVPPSLIF